MVISMIDVGSKIKTLRISQKITQNEFAERLGVTKSAISSYENGSRLPSYDILIKIARIFKVSTDYLLGCTEDKTITVNVSGLTEKQINSIKTSVGTFRTFNVLREQSSEDVQKLIDEFIETGTINGKTVTLE